LFTRKTERFNNLVLTSSAVDDDILTVRSNEEQKSR